MSDSYRATDPEKAYFVTTTIVDWIDLFTRQRCKDIVIDSLKYCQQNKGLEIYAWCLMPSHLHMICRLTGQNSVADIMRDFKRNTSKRLLSALNGSGESRSEWILQKFKEACDYLKRDQKYKVWQNGDHAKELTSNKFIHQKMEYVHNNPVKDGIVRRPEKYLYSSALNYADMEGLLDVVVLPSRMITYS